METVFELTYELQIYVNEKMVTKMSFSDPPIISTGDVLNHEKKRIKIVSIEHEFSTKKQTIMFEFNMLGAGPIRPSGMITSHVSLLSKNNL